MLLTRARHEREVAALHKQLAMAREEHLRDREAWANAAAAERQEQRQLIESLVAQLGAQAGGFYTPPVFAGPARPYLTEQDEVDAERAVEVATEIDRELAARGIDAREPLTAS